ncbi:MAG: alpha-mannosidase [Candidatus Sumerlaeaceae bacterium]
MICSARVVCLALLVAGNIIPGARAAAQDRPSTTDTCLLFAAKNVSKGGGNFFLHASFTMRNVTFTAGDVLEYDMFIDPANPEPTGSLDAQFHPTTINPWDPAGKRYLSNFVETTGGLSAAVGKWHHFKIPLDEVSSRTSSRWNLVMEGRAEGQYAVFVDNVHITGGTGIQTTLYANGNATDPALDKREGYSQYFALVPVSRDRVVDGQDVRSVVKEGIERGNLRREASTLRREFLALGVNNKPLPQDSAETSPTLAELNELATTESENLDAEHFQQVIHRARGMLSHMHPNMRQYTGHLIGHAHIDFQWLWPWTETLQVCHDTFLQMAKFMDEYPGFTFNQSSPALYSATEEKFPEVFARIQKHVAGGQWEIAGGRWCEGDENMISPESHARQFLYGQRYFREKFNGRMTDVGWEPDTFGHVWTMPQILKLGGCKYYYFCRAGYGKPLFWWQGPDGTKVLAFEEPMYGTWYNADLGPLQFEESLRFGKDTGAQDMLWVFGVGNHGGGATREHIDTALEWNKKPYAPTSKFSTAAQFFHSLEKYDLSKLPTVATDLNTTKESGFVGVYTSHSDIKKWNRDSEAMTESAEAIAAFAARHGFEYPTKEFRRNWEDICWNHHHDTLPGTSIHSSYDYSETMYKRLQESSRSIGEKALAHLAARVAGEGTGVVVFNPVGWKRNAVVEVNVPEGASPDKMMALANGSHEKGVSLQEIPHKRGTAVFVAKELPAFGYARFKVQAKVGGSQELKGGLQVSADGTLIENSRYRMALDKSSGQVTSLVDKKSGYEAIAPGGRGNRLEVHKEAPNGMSAWSIGEPKGRQSLNGPVELKVTESGPVRVTVQFSQRYGTSDLVQSVSLTEEGAPEFSLHTHWKELGSNDKPSPFLKVAFDLNLTSPTLTYDIPFGNITRDRDGAEQPALKWVDASDTTCGSALLNDCKHGHSMKWNVLRLSLIRSNYYPDAAPNKRPQSARWSLVPHMGNWREAGVLQTATEFNKPVWVTTATAAAKSESTLPSAASLVSVNEENVVITGVKKAEDDKDLIVRYYEAYGKKADGKLQLNGTAKAAKRVNFIEDDITTEGMPDAPLRPYEIRNVKLAM